jgi:NADPH:quinone reductase-like Zn-dependent oxidoreductase
MLADQIVLSDEGVVVAPAHMSDEEAATLPCAAATAWNALVEHGALAPGETVLVQGTGGVSTFALQIAKLTGARVIATSSSDAKLERVSALGADETINYVTTPEWGKRARELTDGIGVEHVVEVGGAGTLAESIRATRAGGQIALIGVLAGHETTLRVTSVLMQNIRIQGVLVGPRQALERMCKAFELHRLRPVVDRVFPFDEARAAFEHLASGKHLGKVVVRVS